MLSESPHQCLTAAVTSLTSAAVANITKLTVLTVSFSPAAATSLTTRTAVTNIASQRPEAVSCECLGMSHDIVADFETKILSELLYIMSYEYITIGQLT
jgi:hypothetical protein